MTTFDLGPSFAAADARPAPRPADAGLTSYLRQLQADVASLRTEDDTLERAAEFAGPRSSDRTGKDGSNERVARLARPLRLTVAQTVAMVGKLFRRQRGHRV